LAATKNIIAQKYKPFLFKIGDPENYRMELHGPKKLHHIKGADISAEHQISNMVTRMFQFVPDYFWCLN
jgi:hypothetical protein